MLPKNSLAPFKNITLITWQSHALIMSIGYNQMKSRYANYISFIYLCQFNTTSSKTHDLPMLFAMKIHVIIMYKTYEIF